MAITSVKKVSRWSAVLTVTKVTSAQ